MSRSTKDLSHCPYNCVVWAAGDLEQLFEVLGYEDGGTDASLEEGFEKVALFGHSLLCTHAARQLPNGKWTSKLEKAEDIEHGTPRMLRAAITARSSKS